MAQLAAEPLEALLLPCLLTEGLDDGQIGHAVVQLGGQVTAAAAGLARGVAQMWTDGEGQSRCDGDGDTDGERNDGLDEG